ncbi:MAG: ABC transporter ATP-binding protein [Propionibacteriales bacterium]|nr:ABC transporter ATP-binding protein [Propionibacteriales bacterium]
MAYLQAESLRREFPPAVVALADATLEIELGESVAICGRSGSGKSTLLALLGLLDAPSGGSCRIDGVATEQLRRRQRAEFRRTHIGFVFQSFHLIPHLTATENVIVALDTRGTRRSQQRRRAVAELERVGLADRLNSLPVTMSGGEQQRVAIARAVATAPPILLCDEPTGNLDSTTAHDVLEILLTATTATAVVIVTHEEAVASRCDRTVWVNDGVLTETRAE